MRDITKMMIEKYRLIELGYDFMGYEFKKETELSFHHLIVPKRICIAQGVEDLGYNEQNGAILKQSTSHNYLHIVERYDRDMFDAITALIVGINLKGYLDEEYIKRIDGILCLFEKKYSGARTKNGKPLIKEEYTRRRVRR